MKKLSCSRKNYMQLEENIETKTSLKKAEKYIFIQKMTKNKKISSNTKKANIEWKATINIIKNYSNRIKETHFVCSSQLEKFLKIFSSHNYFIFLHLHKNNKQLNELNDMCKILTNSKAKILVFDEYTQITKKVFSNWSHKKITKKESTNNFCVWKNY